MTGAAVYFCTAGIIVMSVFGKIALVIKKAFNIIFKPFIFLKRKLFVMMKKIYAKIYEILKKMKNKFKKPLKDEEVMLYNDND